MHFSSRQHSAKMAGEISLCYPSLMFIDESPLVRLMGFVFPGSLAETLLESIERFIEHKQNVYRKNK